MRSCTGALISYVPSESCIACPSARDHHLRVQVAPLEPLPLSQSTGKCLVLLALGGLKSWGLYLSLIIVLALFLSDMCVAFRLRHASWVSPPYRPFPCQSVGVEGHVRASIPLQKISELSRSSLGSTQMVSAPLSHDPNLLAERSVDSSEKYHALKRNLNQQRKHKQTSEAGENQNHEISVHAIHVSHILLQTEEMAKSLLEEIRSGALRFDGVAELISECSITRRESGRVGWLYSPDFTSPVLPRECTHKLGDLKPGDLRLISSSWGFHICKVDDLKDTFTAKTVTKNKPRYWTSAFDGNNSVTGEKSTNTTTAAERDVGMSYFIETMGCQMNKADSERIAGQLESLGFKVSKPIRSYDYRCCCSGERK
eukprot:GHVQ01013995.1.p1 GENE.GHVQ01013995.1~~GHVQ01013995.1.p1  ORF type:complete len:370 (+),score=31.78 GHVQ01013995.1:553-1662(+)